jgi:hypothetical protein
MLRPTASWSRTSWFQLQKPEDGMLAEDEDDDEEEDVDAMDAWRCSVCNWRIGIRNKKRTD